MGAFEADHCTPSRDRIFGKNSDSPSFVKYIEAAGGVVVPIVNGETNKDVLEAQLRRMNGVLFPGGGDDHYYATGRIVFDLIK
jgi:hypothetical protein